MMRKQYIGLDMVRGIGIFTLVILHAALYYYGGLFDLDMSNPPALVTVIGLFLMFAGLFAMVSGMAHHLQYIRRREYGTPDGELVRHKLRSGLLVLLTGYAYFMFTGPALIDMSTGSYDNSLLVGWILNGRISGFSAERLLYVDSLIMIASNIFLGTLIASAVYKFISKQRDRARAFLLSALSLFALSVVRIPLYDTYLQAVDSGNTFLVLALNWLVNKNNPILPFLAFGLIGMWLAELISRRDTSVYRTGLPLGSAFFALGIAAYINLPDTMLERSIDLKWFSIMGAQLGLFILLILLALRVFDRPGSNPKPERAPRRFIPRFFYRFGVAGLTVFFLESILCALVYRLLQTLNPAVSLTMGQALVFGFSLAFFWGLFLMLWEKVNYRCGLEYWIVHALSKRSTTAKAAKLGLEGPS